MMLTFSKFFLRGIFTFLPAGLTAVLLISFLRWTEEISNLVFSGLAGGFYFPGMGLVIGVLLICGLGFLTTLPQMTKAFDLLELPFKNLPILNSVYSAIKSLSDYFSPESEHKDQQVVMVKFPGLDLELMGLVTRKSLNEMPSGFTKGDRVAVFLPLSYQVGGLTVFIPREYVRPTNMKVEKAMRSALTAWMPNKERAELSRTDF